MFKFFKKDSFWFGAAMGIIIPSLAYGILYLVNNSITNNVSGKHYLTDFMLQILSLVINLLLMRYYLINLKADKTGRGILAVTFIIGITIFILNL